MRIWGLAVFFVVACGARSPLGVDEAPAGLGDPIPDPITTRQRLFMRANQEDLAISDDGVNWSVGAFKGRAAVFAKDDVGNVVLFDTKGHPYFSNDLGDHWTQGNDPEPGDYFGAVVWDGAQFVAAGNTQDMGKPPFYDAVIATSGDGIAWKVTARFPAAQTTFAVRTAGGARIGLQTFADSSIAFVDPSGRRFPAPGFLTPSGEWPTVAFVPRSATAFALCGKNTFCGGSAREKAMLWSTTDGETWTLRPHSVAIDDGRFLAAAEDRVGVLGVSLAQSLDGESWTTQHVDGIDSGSSLSFASGRFQILGERKTDTRLIFAVKESNRWTATPTVDLSGPPYQFLAVSQ